jgi:DNA invertase Pin-like site-specific DNA recombinase
MTADCPSCRARVRRRAQRTADDRAGGARHAGFLLLTIRNYGRAAREGRVSDESLAALVRARAELDDALVETVAAYRRNGESWSQVARTMGVSQQAVSKTWRRKVADRYPDLGLPDDPGTTVVVAATSSALDGRTA